MNCNELQEQARPSRYLVKRPKALQWFHNGRLYKASDEERQAGRFELFLDLLYVAIVANFSEELAEHPDGAHLAKYILIFAPAWHIWADLREIMNSYYTDDLAQRLVILWVMALLVLYANNAPVIGSGADAAESLAAIQTAAGAYVAARFTAAAVFLVSSFASYQHRVQARIMAGFMLGGMLLTIPLFLPGVDLATGKAPVAAVLIVYQEATWALTLSPWIKRRLRLTYSTAVDIAHEIDRLAAFFIIILGEFVYSVIVGNPAGVGLTSGYAKAVCVLVVAFCLNWLYVSGDGSLAATHPIRRSAWTAFGFFLLHLPLSASFLIGGHVAAIGVGEEVYEMGQEWLLCGGLATGLACLWVYAMLYSSHDDADHHDGRNGNGLLLPKTLRIGMRLVGAILLVFLPLMTRKQTGGNEPAVDARTFLAIVTAIVVFITLWEMIGGLTRDFAVFEKWDKEARNPPVENGSDEPGLVEDGHSDE
ncbi:bacterial low temperature requirement A protein-domain-containing protein [Microdochium trichocladiopsis]|uniref:Bacterial low temperature requirement A protein-domain-containing protein n=1 Tax=Microdochium trichocladiopsis TaxID=1682393 RepID=A0A9P9BKG4_9PEZI|nr:bacterial low temperature requirement A protein-domain-containing protein [Microdochium trichocladiopsis]KAH7026604.1 bacterial low temperature requirement A protein-domain-containing protein [Microdochium trichocladiopsis]